MYYWGFSLFWKCLFFFFIQTYIIQNAYVYLFIHNYGRGKHEVVDFYDSTVFVLQPNASVCVDE